MAKILARVKSKPIAKDVLRKTSSKSEIKTASPKKTRKISSDKKSDALQKVKANEAAKKIGKLEARVETLKGNVKVLKNKLNEANKEIEKLHRRIENQVENQREEIQRIKDGRDYLFPNIPHLSEEDDGVVTFAVDAAGHYEADEWLISRYTSNLDSAKELADALVDKGHKCVRLYERGNWSNRSGNKKTGFVAFWWSDSDYVGEMPKGRGYGIPEGQKQRIEYTPIVRWND